MADMDALKDMEAQRDRWIAAWRAVSDEFVRLDAEVKSLRAAMEEALRSMRVCSGSCRGAEARIRAIAAGTVKP